MNHGYSLAFVAALAVGCATAQDGKPAPAKADCTPAPKQLVTRDITTGTGPDIALRSVILVGYTGWLYDPCAKDFKGAQFDTSDGRATPFGLIVGTGKVIKGWDEGVIGMKQGGKRMLIIPPDKAYGERSPTPKIPPNSTLVFEVSIIQIIGNAPPPAPPK